MLAAPIYRVIYPAAPMGYDLLALTAISLIFSALSQTMSGALQGIGKVYVPAIGLLVGCLIKIILNVLLIRIPEVNIYGAVVSSIVCQIVAFLISFIVMAKYITLKIGLIKYIVKPLIAGVLMGAAVWGAYTLCQNIFGFTPYITNLVSVILSIAIGAIVYGVLVFVLKILNEEEVKMLPGGTSIYRMLVKLKIYK